MRPVMTDAEMNLFKTYLANCHVYFEYGCGGSTCLASTYWNIEQMYTVDSTHDWVSKVKEEPSVQQKISCKQIEFYVIDIDANPNYWGFPKSEAKKENWPLYSTVMTRICPMKQPNVILVDGRFRVACTIQSVLSCTGSPFICIHDYTHRPYYHVVETFLDKVDQVDTLVILQKPNDKNIDEKALVALYDTYKYDVR